MKNLVNYITQEEIDLCDVFKAHSRMCKKALSKKHRGEEHPSITEEEFKVILDNHDFYYEFSDSGSVWRAGTASRETIEAIVKLHPEYSEIYSEYNSNGGKVVIGRPENPTDDVWYRYRLYQMEVSDKDAKIVTDVLNAFKVITRLAIQKDLYIETPETPRYVRDENGCKVRLHTLLVTKEVEDAAKTIVKSIKSIIPILKLNVNLEDNEITCKLDVWDNYNEFHIYMMDYNHKYEIIEYNNCKMIINRK